MRKKLATLLRAWAQKLSPENRTLPEGYEVAAITASYSYIPKQPEDGHKFRPVPHTIELHRIKSILLDRLITKLETTPDAWPVHADLAMKPGDRGTYKATLYVGVSLEARRRRENRQRIQEILSKLK